MPVKKPARRSIRARQRNTPLRTRSRTFVAKARRHILQGDTELAERAVHDASVALDKAARSGAIHPNNAARRKSRIMRQLNQARQA